MNALRSIGALFTGFIVFGVGIWLVWTIAGYDVCTDIPSTEFLIGSLIYECILGFCVGLFIGWMAGRSPLVHALILAGFISLLTLIGLLMGQYKGPMWPHLGTLFLVSPSVVLGGYLLKRLQERAENGTSD